MSKDEKDYEDDKLASGEHREIEGERHEEVVDRAAERHPRAERGDVDKALRAAKKSGSKIAKIPVKKAKK
jgi:hypothetical protein